MRKRAERMMGDETGERLEGDEKGGGGGAEGGRRRRNRTGVMIEERR